MLIMPGLVSHGDTSARAGVRLESVVAWREFELGRPEQPLGYPGRQCEQWFERWSVLCEYQRRVSEQR